MREFDQANSTDLRAEPARNKITMRLAGWRVRENHTRRLITMKEAALERQRKINEPLRLLL